MNDPNFDKFMNDVMVHKNTAKKQSSGYELELGDKKEEIIALYTEQHISRRIIFDNLVNAGIINKDKSFRSFSEWMGRSIKRNKATNAEKDRKVHPVEDSED